MPVVLGGLVVAALTMLLIGGTELDRGLLLLIGEAAGPQLRQASAAVVATASPLPLMVAIGIGAGFLLVRASWRPALLLAACGLGAQLLTASLPGITQPLRPGLSDLVFPTQQQAFPDPVALSAAATAMALAFLLTHRAPWRSLALFGAAAFALSAGAARLLLGLAWPSDVIGGWGVGLCWTLLLLGIAGHDMSDGTPRPVRHFPRKGEPHGREPQDADRARDGR